MSFLLSFALIQICISTPIHPEERIVNGEPIPANYVPWQASLRRGYDIGNFIYQQSFCGGSLIEIDPPIILTAAHCVDRFYENITDGTIRMLDNATSGANTILENLNIDLNRTYANHDMDSFTTLEIYDINFIHIHEDWDTDNIAAGNDIALIIFSEHNNTMDPMPNIWYPILPTTLDTCCDENQELYATGYGANASNSGPTDTLEITVLKYMDKPECESRNAVYKLLRVYWIYMSYNITNDFTENIVAIANETKKNATMDAIMNPQLNTICADGNGTDTCQGDSGGPLWRINDENITELIGVVSYGMGCSIDDPFSVPAYYTNVAYYYRWIQKVITYVLLEETFNPTDMPTEMPTAYTNVPTGTPTTVVVEETDTFTTEANDSGANRICYELMMVVAVVFAAYNI